MLDLSRLVLDIDMVAVGRKARMLPPAVLRVLRHFDGARNMAEAIDQSSLENSLAIAVVRRLVKQGLLKPAWKVTRAAGVEPVNPALWKWFASPAMETAPATKKGVLKEYRLTAALKAALDTTLKDSRARLEQRNRETSPCVVHVDPEHSLEQALEQRFLEAGWADDEGAGSFTSEELEFFESYQSEVQDEDSFADLVGDPSGSS